MRLKNSLLKIPNFVVSFLAILSSEKQIICRRKFENSTRNESAKQCFAAACEKMKE